MVRRSIISRLKFNDILILALNIFQQNKKKILLMFGHLQNYFFLYRFCSNGIKI